MEKAQEDHVCKCGTEALKNAVADLELQLRRMQVLIMGLEKRVKELEDDAKKEG